MTTRFTIPRARLTAIVQEAARLQAAGQFIESIKYLRYETGSSLSDAYHAAVLLRQYPNGKKTKP